MRHSGDIFEQENYRGTGFRTVSGVRIAMFICSAISILAAICIIANFGMVMARIAMFVANLLSSGFSILVIVLAVVYFIARLNWKLRRSFWGW